MASQDDVFFFQDIPEFEDTSNSEDTDSLKDISLEDGEITMMLASSSEDESCIPTILIEYDFDMNDTELKNIEFPPIQETSSAPTPASQQALFDTTFQNINLEEFMHFLEEASKKEPPLHPNILKARRKIDFDDIIREKTTRKQMTLKNNEGPSASSEFHSPPCELGDDCFICKCCDLRK